ncbi:MAG: colanic acid biosynthesis glycosyltransferase WcaL [Desulfobulbaceae bacterium]|nr:MAG: colanic acid biosynthesis glycosyltransferase WcaL [Desulfobulbaceae bacterium]
MKQPNHPTLAYILKGYPRISETFISNEILLLEQRGFKMHLFPMRKPRENFTHDSVKKIQAAVDYLPTELSLDFVKLIIPNLLLVAAQPKRYFSALKLALDRYRQNRKIATIKHLFQAGYMVWYHLRKDPSIVHLHGHFAHSPTSVTMFASQLSGLPFSFTAHAKDIYTSDPEKLREKIGRADFVITCTLHNKAYLESLIKTEFTAVHCVYHGIDLSLFHNQQQQITARPPYQIFTIARLTPKKGLPTIYRALRILKDKGIDFHHTLIGDGDDREQILALIDQLELSDYCTWLGTQNHTQVLDRFRQSHLFVLGCEIAKNGDRDGIPNVLVESLAMGVPAVSTNVSAIPEILIHEESGLTVPPRDPDALAAAMSRLLQDEQLRRKVIEQGRALVHEKFDNTMLIKAMVDIFRTGNSKLSEQPLVSGTDG